MEERPTKYLKMSEPPSITGRPIVGSPNCPTHKLSNLLDLILKPLAFQVKSYVKDSFHFLEMLPKSIDFDSTFVTFDMTSLYTNIPKELGLEALSIWIDRFPESLTESRFTKEFVIAGFEIVLTFNYFMFDGKWYLQIKGVTMETKATVILAILTVGYLEIKLYTILPNYFSTEYTKYIIEHWKRFIDDCFITWKKNENLDLFQEILNNLHPSIKFTKDTDVDRISFLDLLVIKTAEGKIETDIFYKKTNAHRYLCFESAHPRKIKRNIPFTLAQRMTRIVSNPDRREQRFKELTEFLKECHYPDELIKNCTERAKAPFTNSNELTGLEEDTLVFVSTYIPNLSFDENSIRKRIEVVQTKHLKQAFNNTKIIFAKRQPKNLKQLLTSSTFSSSTPQPTEIGIAVTKDVCYVVETIYS